MKIAFQHYAQPQPNVEQPKELRIPGLFNQEQAHIERIHQNIIVISNWSDACPAHAGELA